MDALTFGLVPLIELFFLLMYLVVPVTIGLVIVGIGLGVEFGMHGALVIYFVPMEAVGV
jgi:hypothetical protein